MDTNSGPETVSQLVPIDRPADTDAQDRQLLDLVARSLLLGRDPALGAFVQPIQPGPALLVRRGLDGWLRRKFHERYEGTPSNDAVSRAVAMLEALADELGPTPLYLRVGRAHSGPSAPVVLDLGEADSARAAVLEAGKWRIVDESPCPFFRTRLSGQHPRPEPDPNGSLEPLWGFVAVPKELRPLVVAWLVAALIPEIDHPVLHLEGPAGSGKTTAARALARLIDPFGTVSGQVRGRPRDERDWSTSLRSSWVVAIDNVRTVPLWLSDALCTVVTGASTVERQLYTNAEAHVMEVRRAVILTSIGLEELADDLADRSLRVPLERPTSFLSERTLKGAIEDARPQLLGGLLNVAAAVLAKWETLVGNSSHRLADFGLLVRAVDDLWGSDAELQLDRVESTARRAALESSPLAAALLEMQRPWSFTKTDLWELLAGRAPARVKTDWPRSPRGLTIALRRLHAALQEYGVRLDIGDHLEQRDGKRGEWVDCGDVDEVQSAA
jgi:hypothetical protein